MSVLNPHKSSAVQFLDVLMGLGVIKRGGLTLVDIQHDEGCPAIGGTNINCRCCPHILIEGKRYSFDADTGEVFCQVA
jgi:hypothetical protein